MPSCSKNEVLLVRYPFSDATSAKVRPAVVVSAAHTSRDLFILPLTSRTASLLDGEFVLTDWQPAGLNVESAVKRGVYTLHENLVIRSIGKLSDADAQQVQKSLKSWLGLS